MQQPGQTVNRGVTVPTADLHHLEIVLLFLMGVVAALAALARRFQTPYPIVLVIGGLIASLVPNLPRVPLNPDVVFFVLLPPLLFSAAYHTSWRNFRKNLTGILLLAFGLVGFTVAALAIVSGWLLPDFDHRTGFVLGALVASTDAVAASAIAKRLGLPRRIIDLLEGESLVNDATSLVALEFAVAMMVSNQLPTIGAGALRMIYLSVIGVLIGLLTGRLIRWGQTRLTDAPIEILLTLVAPYLADLSAESVHASGVLATVACGLYLGNTRSQSLSMHARLESEAIWSTLDFALNGLVSILIGLQLPHILAGIRGLRLSSLLLDGVLLVLVLTALRMAWVFTESWIAHGIRVKMKRPENRPQAKEMFLVGWTGMRGLVTLAAAISLPVTLNDGSAFPQRDVLIFLIFCVILFTLLVQGLTLPFLIRKMGLAALSTTSREEHLAHSRILNSVIDEIRSLRSTEVPVDQKALADLLHYYHQRFEEVCTASKTRRLDEPEYAEYRRLESQLRAVESSTVLRMYDQNEINDEVLRKVEQELNLLDARHLSSHP
jgi:CPA1 family monovalent cation:H+ antiporter